jgi:hypothetical protein
MSVCGIVFDKVNVRIDGKTTQKTARIIIGFSDASRGATDITFSNKFIHYPESDIVHHDLAFLYNGIDAKTISNQGEKRSHVVDWFRAAIRHRTVVVCGTSEIMELIGDTHCNLIDLQSFFYSKTADDIREPISLVRLANRFFGYDPATAGKRDPFQECRYRIGLYYVMRGFQASAVSPPFADDMFPKIAKLLPGKRPFDNTDGLTASKMQDAFTKLTSPTKPLSLVSAAFDQHEYYGEENFYENDTPRQSPKAGLSPSSISSLTLKDGETRSLPGRGMSINLMERMQQNANDRYHERAEIPDCDECHGPTINVNISLCKTKTKFSANILKGILSCMSESV